MNKIISKERFSEKVFKFEIEAPLIAKSRKAGHFVIVRVGEKGERMPLTIAGSDLKKGTITLVVQEVGLSSTRLCELNEGESITDVVGPLGQATHIEKFGTVICAGGGVGVAPMLPIVQALKAAGNRVITVLAGRNKDLIILEKEMRESSDEVIIMTDDGSYGRKGLVTEGVEEVIKREKIDIVHFHFGSYLIAPFLRILFPRIRIISTRHSEIFVSNKLKKLYLKFCFFPFERFLCVSCGVKKEMIEGVGFSSKSEVLYLGVRKKKIVNPNLKKTLDIPKGVVVLTTIGFNIRIKGFDILVKSIQSLMDSNRLKNDIIVLVIGISENSEDSNSLRQLIAEAGLNRKIMSLGIRNDINDILNISDIYLQPSRTEGLSLSIMEALNYSLPVIGTRVGGIPEIVHEGENGYLFEKENVEELADRIEILVNNREVREMMGRKSKVISSRFTLADGVEKLASIYHQTN